MRPRSDATADWEASSSLHVDVQDRTHETDRQIFKVESVGCVVVTVEHDPRQADIVQDEVASILHAREKVFDSCPGLATRGRPFLFPVVVKGRRGSVIVQAKVLSDTFCDAVGVLSQIERDRKTCGQPEPLVVEVKEHWPPSWAMEFDPPITFPAI
jgi:hypothetical protein